jgi:threonine/homoserine/homoserine lactone efflux protein
VRAVIGDVLPLAIAAAISPFPIIGVVLMLVTPRARVNGPMFIVGWLVGLAVVGALGLLVIGAAGASDDGEASTGASLFRVVLGAVLLGLAVRQWLKRPRAGDEPKMPSWMNAVDHFSARKAATTGFALSAVNPKNLILTLAATTTIAASDLSSADQAIAYGVYGLIATLGVAAPLVVYFTMGSRAAAILDSTKSWLAQNNAAIMAVIFLVLGAQLIGAGIAG